MPATPDTHLVASSCWQEAAGPHPRRDAQLDEVGAELGAGGCQAHVTGQGKAHAATHSWPIDGGYGGHRQLAQGQESLVKIC